MITLIEKKVFEEMKLEVRHAVKRRLWDLLDLIVAQIDINQFLRIRQRLIRQHLESIANKLEMRRVNGQGW